jgi:Na+-transporting NADH:ubiquinone oxidoreductase subunit NqrE
MIPVLFLGTVLGACIGAGLGVWAIEVSRGRKMEESIRCGVGAGLGEMLGITAKAAIGVIIWLTVAVAAVWP